MPSGGGSSIWRTASPAHPSAPGADWSGDWGEFARGDSLPQLSSPVFRPFWQLMGVTADELPRNSGPGTRISKPPLPPPRPSASIGVFFQPPIVLNDEGDPPSSFLPVIRRSPWRDWPFPRFENRRRPFSSGLPSAPRPMGCRFRGPFLGEIVSPRLLGSLWTAILSASAFPPMQLGGWRGLATRPSRQLRLPHGDGRHHRRPELPNAPSRLLSRFSALREGGRAEIAPSPAFPVPRSVGSGKRGGTDTGPISVL